MTDTLRNRRHQQLLSLYQAALRSVNGEQAVRQYFEEHPLPGEWAVVAIGKAAAAMAKGGQQALGERLHSGLVITKYGHAAPSLQANRWRVLESGHPLPDENSLRAGETLLEFLHQLPNEIPLLFLLSGGASSLVEVLPDGLGLEELERVNDWLLSSGLTIGEMNRVRKHLSAIKAGRLARHLGGRRCLQMLISDVPGDDPATIGSAPLYPSAALTLPNNLPEWLKELVDTGEPSPEESEPVFATIETHIIASNARARQAVSEAARSIGLTVKDHPGHFQGKVDTLAAEFVDELLASPAGVLLLWGGESSVALPLNPGRGGRNQHMALAAAKLLAGREDCLLLAAGTDGSDGPTEEAGALVDGMTVRRGEEEGSSAEAALREADSGRFLEVSGDLIETGPTGTNVMDLVIAWKWDVSDAATD